MSLVRATLTLVQAIAHHSAMTPPNPTPKKGRYHTEELYILQIAPFIFWLHSVALWIFAAFETLLYLTTIHPAPTYASPAICPASSSSPASSSPHVLPTTLFTIGSILILAGSVMRLDCFRALGELFTFDLTVHPAHKLVKTRLYGIVRHPSYTGSMFLVAGIALAHLTRGGWVAECIFNDWSRWALWALWWTWTISVGISRARAEDKQMRLLFGDDWVQYARDVHWWFVPYLL
ncbi:uncharacterized protein BT62DRAFT_338250 [Guyanagaster necrorhizus]|uniref:Protein-S-isoprenylcysteine O-methyltransferase n=1 Tax=Guyanagaster necrorhizus TaxID=856835 RepID=A0A9P8APE4_9AGAR|nr:uncharacterized protein BT62DRAFT_338250 [Guyanagaster necrorhizus MCA 3950]KAG7443253.1 hypothetical protein BT62DRAFT_338250 [Guyanagaster necrorhizus MCA 3950]